MSLKSKFSLLAPPNCWLSAIWRSLSIVFQNFKPPQKVSALSIFKLEFCKESPSISKKLMPQHFLWVFYTFSAAKKETQLFRCVFSPANVGNDSLFIFHRGFTQFVTDCIAWEGLLNLSCVLKGRTQFAIDCTAWEGLLNLLKLFCCINLTKDLDKFMIKAKHTSYPKNIKEKKLNTEANNFNL